MYDQTQGFRGLVKVCRCRGVTDEGSSRDSNEDRYLIKKFDDGSLLMAVADGLGGHEGGGYAADRVIEAFDRFDPTAGQLDEELLTVLSSADAAIKSHVAEHPRLEGMGSTAAAIFVQRGKAWWCGIGDSRVYHLGRRGLKQLSHDQTLVQFLVDEGEIDAEAAQAHPHKNVLYYALGCPDPEYQSGQIELQAGDQLMLSTDGVHDVLSRREMEALLAAPLELDKRVNNLIDAALKAGSRDNLTVAVAACGSAYRAEPKINSN